MQNFKGATLKKNEKLAKNLSILNLENFRSFKMWKTAHFGESRE